MPRSSVADILCDQVTLSLACLDRMYLNVYIPRLQYEGGVAGFLHSQCNAKQRKDDVAAKYRREFTGEEGLLFIGKAQEKSTVCRTANTG